MKQAVFDDANGDGDEFVNDADYPDCAPCFPDDSEPTAGVNSATLQFITAETAEGGGGPVCPVEEGDECVDGTDNDGDGVIDEEDPDCSIEDEGASVLILQLLLKEIVIIIPQIPRTPNLPHSIRRLLLPLHS